MFRIAAHKIYIASAVLLSACLAAFGQDAAPSPTPKGSIKFIAKLDSGKVDDKGKPILLALERKRFYLIRGNLQENAALLKQIAGKLEEMEKENVLSRDCYYADLRRKGNKITDQYICWLKKDDCESPYCREIKTEQEVLTVPEFAAAYREGLREYRQSALALKWLTTNLRDDYIRNGFYVKQKSILKSLVAFARDSSLKATQTKKGIVCETAQRKKDPACENGGFQSIMTDRRGNGFFLDIDVVPPQNVEKDADPKKKKKEAETYLVSNLAPIVLGNKSFIWTCEVEVDVNNPQAQFNLNTLIKSKKKKCEVVEKPQPEVCNLPDCVKAAEKPAESN